MPESFRALGFISPTGFENKAAAGFIRRSNPWVRAVLNGRPWSNALFRLMMRRSVIRRFVEKTWGSKKIDEGLLDYDCLIAYQSGAEHAPFSFIASYMFTPHILDAYRALRLPVWMVHGVRGDFVSYPKKRTVEGRENWTIDVLPTGAFPQFEVLPKMLESYESFLAELDGAGLKAAK